MQRFNFAASRHVNPPGATPRLTEAELWRGLELKARDPVNFISSVTSCDVLEDTGNKLLRSISFDDNPPLKEQIELCAKTIAYFEALSEGIRIANVISYDEQGELVLTFSFAGGIPNYQPTGEAPPSPQDLNKVVGMGIESTIRRIRGLVLEGEINV